MLTGIQHVIKVLRNERNEPLRERERERERAGFEPFDRHNITIPARDVFSLSNLVHEAH